jgi:hypothetical protein
MLSTQLAAQSDDAAAPAAPLRAKYLITTADDFVVDMYLNGKPIPDAKRTLLEERYGATVERVDVEVHRGDWLVFNVVNNRLRWGGTRYFGLAGCFAQNEFGFVSDRASRQWSACDSPRDADRFITRKSFCDRRPVRIVENPWSDGDGLMRQYAGSNWSGSPVWGRDRNTWIKVVVE